MILKSTFKKSKRISFVIMLLLGLLTFNQASAQKGSSVTGIVKDESGIPLPGVNIAEKGKKNAVSSDFDGKFSITLTEENAVLLFTYIGFENKSVTVSGKSVLSVSLKSSAETLGEVKIVSFGYGTVKKSNLTGAVASISAKDLAKIPVANVSEAMVGRLAGVSVQSVDGAPGSDVMIRVRGGSSITQNNAPLYVVDGFVVPNLNEIPPGDIASIDVLKDAATTAIYGSQGSNGVVVVTTKKPKAGKTTITYNNYVQISTMPKERKYEVLSPYEFATMQYEKAKMSTTSSTNTELEKFEKYFGKFDDLDIYKDKEPSDWQEDVLGKEVVSFYNNLSISGGSESTKFLFSYSANNDSGLIEGTGQKRDVINFKLNHDISKKIQLNLSARVSNRVVNGAGTSGTSQLKIKNIITSRPTNGIADELDPNAGGAVGDDDYQLFLNSLISPTELAKQDWRKKTTNDYVFSGGLVWNILDNLTAKSTLSVGRMYGENLRFYGPLTQESINNGDSRPLGVKTDDVGSSYVFTNTVNYNFKNIGKNTLGVLVGQEVRSKSGYGQEVRTEYFRETITPQELFANMQLGKNLIYNNTYENTDENMFSLFARADYAYNDKYLFTATVRRDASSKFQGSNAIGIFPAFSAGWKISSESFLKDSKVVQELKLRASYGETGNDQIPSNSTSLIFTPNSADGPGWGNTINTYYSPKGKVLFNPDLKWETTLGRDIGLDFRFFSIITGSFDVYRNTTSDLLLQSQIPTVSGFESKWDNIGNTTNQGMELSLNVNLINKKDFSLGVNLNFGTNKTTIDALDGLSTDRYFQSNWASSDLKEQNDYYIAVGRSVGLIYGYSNAGMYSVNDFDQINPTTYKLKAGVPDAGSLLNAPVKPGSMKVEDTNGDGKIDAADAHIIGNTTPKAQGGFGLSGNYKAFDFSMFFNWSYGNDVYNTGKIDYNQLYRTTYGNMLNTMNSANRFTYIDMDGTYGPAGEVVTNLVQLGEMNQGKTIWSGNTSFGGTRAVLTDWAVEDGSYVRLNNVTIGYTLPINQMKKSIISSVRLYVTGSNLALWTNYSGYDPDANTSRSDDAGGFSSLTPGLDYSAYPRSRSFTFGLNATF
jgi:TonB-linked SusC/RagA family outer membrane protein